MDSDWLSLFYRSPAGKKTILKVIPTISFLCPFIIIVFHLLYLVSLYFDCP